MSKNDHKDVKSKSKFKSKDKEKSKSFQEIEKFFTRLNKWEKKSRQSSPFVR